MRCSRETQFISRTEQDASYPEWPGDEMQGRACMNVSLRQPASFLVPAVRHRLLPHWLTHLGGLGIFLVAVIDSSLVPLPLPGSTDLLLLWLVAYGGNPWLLTSLALAGSLIGGYSTWELGRRGGEAALKRHVPARLLRRIVKWVERHRILAVFLPAVLPPPIPLTPFLLASGALGVSRRRFLVLYGGARTLRYSLIAWLAVAYGRHAIRLWSATLQKWSIPLIWVFLTLLTASIGFGIWKVRSLSRPNAAAMRA